jgi:hypothetical protein
MRDPDSTSSGEPPESSNEGAAPKLEKKLAGGRSLPNLLFVTSSDRLKASIGDAAEAATKMINAAGQDMFEIGAGAEPWKDVSAAARGKAGVVLVGGYDVVPSLKLDSLPKPLRRLFGNSNDPDDFRVWNDDGYADLNGNGLADVPVSRVPDGHSADLLLAALSGSTSTASAARFGLRNAKRPFADRVYSVIPGSETMLSSAPALVADATPQRLNAEHLYLMLHGSSSNTGLFWGEEKNGAFVEALKASSIEDQSGGVVFAGCCYGALTVEERPHELGTGESPTIVSAEDSIALRFLAKGASAFVGCTGAHYSPGPSCRFGSHVLHKAFWQQLISGKGPAEALFNAKIDFVKAMQIGADAGTLAVFFKTWRQFTCLGLGW